MAGQSITLLVPDDLYQRVKQEAVRSHRSVEEELLEAVAGAVPEASALPNDLATAVDQLAFLDDAVLLRAARSHLSRKAARRMEALHLKRQRAGLDAGEPQELEVLVRMFERKMLIRAHAMLLVTQRGLDIASRVPGA